MAGGFVNLSGLAVQKCRITIPWYGAWIADVVLGQSNAIPTTPTLSIGTFALVGTVVRSSSFSGSRSARIVGGAGGWRKAVPGQAYNSPIGVLLSTVLKDAAIAVGETVNVIADRSIGLLFARAAGPASDVLHALSGGSWWVDVAGVTQVGARSGRAITSAFQVLTFSGGRGLFTIATETPADWIPGNTFSSPTVTQTQTIASVTQTIDNEGVARLEVLAA